PPARAPRRVQRAHRLAGARGRERGLDPRLRAHAGRLAVPGGPPLRADRGRRGARARARRAAGRARRAQDRRGRPSAMGPPRVLVTGPLESLSEYAQAARAAGWEAVEKPLLRIEPSPFDRARLS